MSAEYIAINEEDPRNGTPVVWCVCRVSDSKEISYDVTDPDTQEYLSWLDAGNKPDIVQTGGFPWDPGYGEEPQELIYEEPQPVETSGADTSNEQ
jgi:hypothetical protein